MCLLAMQLPVVKCLNSAIEMDVAALPGVPNTGEEHVLPCNESRSILRSRVPRLARNQKNSNLNEVRHTVMFSDKIDKIEFDEEFAEYLGVPNVYLQSFLERLGRPPEIYEFPVDISISEHSKAEALLRAHELEVDIEHKCDHRDIVVWDVDD